eukprot:14506022-Ditylum_brightwellii.AAC.1
MSHLSDPSYPNPVFVGVGRGGHTWWAQGLHGSGGVATGLTKSCGIQEQPTVQGEYGQVRGCPIAVQILKLWVDLDDFVSETDTLIGIADGADERD